MPPGPSVAHRFVAALARGDFSALEASLNPAVQFRALVPGETVTAVSAAETVAAFKRWFGDITDVEIVEQRIETLVDTVRVDFRLRLRKKGQLHQIAQSLCGEPEHDRFVKLDLLCTGFRPEEPSPSPDTTHLFDAGDLGCGSGLPREFRTRIGQVPIGHVLEVVTADPSAKEDLPSLARLLGHRVLAVEVEADGKSRIRVERSR